MSIFNIDLKPELSQMCGATDIIISEQLKPMLEDIVDRSGHQIDGQRQLASQDAKDIIDHATSRLETVFNEKLDQARNDVLITSEKILRTLTVVALMIGLSAVASIIVAASVLMK